MRTEVTRLSSRLVVALLTFMIGVAVTLLWIAPRLREASTPRVSIDPVTPERAEVSFPEGWKRIEVQDSLTMWLPPDMKPAELIGDSPGHREAYNNRELNLTIVYGGSLPCDTPRVLLESPTYHESVIEIAGKKAKIGVERRHKSEYMTAQLCFLDSDGQGKRLNLAAICKDDRALDTAHRIFTSIKFKK